MKASESLILRWIVAAVIVCGTVVCGVSVCGVSGANAQTSRPATPSREVEIVFETSLRDVTRQIEDMQAGQTLDASTYALANANVVLTVARPDGGPERIEARTDAEGKVSIPLGVRPTQTPMTLQAEKDGVLYLTRARPLQEKMPDSLQAYRVTRDRSQIQQTFFVSYRVDPSTGRIRARQVQSFVNHGFSVYVGTEDEPGLSYSIPAEAEPISLRVNNVPVSSLERREFSHGLSAGIPIQEPVYPSTAQAQGVLAIGDFWVTAAAAERFYYETTLDFESPQFWVGYAVGELRYPFQDVDEEQRMLASSELNGPDGELLRIWKRDGLPMGTTVVFVGEKGEQTDFPKAPTSRPSDPIHGSAADPHSHGQGTGAGTPGEEIEYTISLGLVDTTRLLIAQRQGQQPPDTRIRNAPVTIYSRLPNGKSDTTEGFVEANGMLTASLGTRRVGDPVLIRLKVDGKDYVSEEFEVTKQMPPGVYCFQRIDTPPEPPQFFRSLSLILTDDTKYQTEKPKPKPKTDGEFKQGEDGSSEWVETDDETEVKDTFEPPEPNEDGLYTVRGRAIMEIAHDAPYVYEPPGGILDVMPCLEGATVTSLTANGVDVFDKSPRKVEGYSYGVPIPVERVYPLAFNQAMGKGRGITVIGSFEYLAENGEELIFQIRAPTPLSQMSLALGIGRFHYDSQAHPQNRRFVETQQTRIMNRDVAQLSLGGGVGADTTVPLKLVYGEKPIHKKTQLILIVVGAGLLAAILLSIFMSTRRRQADPVASATIEMELLDQRRARGELTEDEYEERIREAALRISSERLSDAARRELDAFVERYRDADEVLPGQLVVDVDRLARHLRSSRGRRP